MTTACPSGDSNKNRVAKAAPMLRVAFPVLTTIFRSD
jgi:hypothetical protein